MLGGIFGRQRPRQDLPEPDPELAEALVRADETMRRGTEELGYATAQFGEAATREFGTALTAARGHAQEAFRLNALLLDEHPETPEEARSIAAGARAQAAEVERLVRAEADRFASRRAALREVPDAVAALGREMTDVRTRIDGAQQALTALESRYRPDALVAVSDNPEQAQALLEVAGRSLELATRRHDRGQGDDATRAVQVASDSIRRADDLLEAVSTFEVEAVHAESTLASVLADSRSDVAASRQWLQTVSDEEVAAATAALEERIAQSADADGGGPADPFARLARLREANERLDRLRDERATRPSRERLQAQLGTAVEDARRQVGLARSIVVDHPGQTGPDARTRLAQAERLLDGLGSVDDPPAALAQARRAAEVAVEAAELARRDIATAAQQERWTRENGGRGGWGQDDGRGGGWGGGWGGGGGGWGGGRGSGMGGVLGGVLGGMVLGGILDDIGDLDLD